MIQAVYSLFAHARTVTSHSTRTHFHQFSTTTATLNMSMENFNPRLRSVIAQMDAIAPRFELAKDEIEIINHPIAFYGSLKEKIMNAKSRIFLSTLYIGKTQEDLIACLQSALAANKDLKVHILADSLRSTREAPKWSSASLLTKLVDEFGDARVDIRLYHTPHLNGLAKALVPRRLNEGWGLQHMKLYGFDDEVILTGANLSEDYFTNRQDRYYVFKHKSLTDYYFKIHQAVASLSYKLLSSPQTELKFKLEWPNSNVTCEPHMNLQRYVSDASHLLQPLLKPQAIDAETTKDAETLVYAVSQFTPLMHPDLSTEKPAILRLLSSLDSKQINWVFTAGYFNMDPEIQTRLLNSVSSGTIITASPQSNSFYLSKGISQYLPDAYLYLAKKFLAKVYERNKQDAIHVREWQNGIVNTPTGWSYHAKGIWLSNPEEKTPSITVVGSSNYTRRAYSLDLETNAIVITKDEALKQKMADEIENLSLHSKELKLEDFEQSHRSISRGVMLATEILGGRL